MAKREDQTTITLDPALKQQVQIEALKRKTTLGGAIAEGLQWWLRSPNQSASTVTDDPQLTPASTVDTVPSHAPAASGEQYLEKIVKIMKSPFWPALEQNLEAFYKAAIDSEKLDELRRAGKLDFNAVAEAAEEIGDEIERDLAEGAATISRKEIQARKATDKPGKVQTTRRHSGT